MPFLQVWFMSSFHTVDIQWYSCISISIIWSAENIWAIKSIKYSVGRFEVQISGVDDDS